MKCLFCHLSTDSDTAAEEYVVNILGYPSQFEVERTEASGPCEPVVNAGARPS